MKDELRPYVVTARRLLRRQLRLTDIGYARQISYSQFGEDLWLADYFAGQERGLYVDVGAFDPFDGSNTLLLYRRGWSGINIEPDPGAIARLRRFRPRDVNLEVAIDEAEGPSEYLRAGTFGGIPSEGYLWGEDAGTERILIRARRLEDVLIEQGVCEFDLLDVDCEGRELQALRSNDWTRFRPRVVLLEIHPGASESASDYLTEVGYREAARLQLTRAFERID
jgi:FkbM family methyltransferase